MLETDAGSRKRFAALLALPILLFGGFAVWGVANRAGHGGVPSGFGIGDAAPVPVRRAADLALRKRAFAARRRMANFGRTGDWRAASGAADDFLRTDDDRRVRLLHAEALMRAHDPVGGAEMAAILKQSGAVDADEAALLSGDTATYARLTDAALSAADETKLSPLDANNLAWRAALASSAASSANAAKAVRLAERAVAAARSATDARYAGDLATYTNTLGAVYARVAGREADALRLLTESERLRHDPFNVAFLSIVEARLGNAEAARNHRAQVQSYLTETFAGRDGQSYRHELLILWREITR